jgi:hypothetical protein
MTSQEQPDSQAGDELRRKIMLLLEDFQETSPTALLPKGEKSFDEKFMDLFTDYAERLAAERAIEELKRLDLKDGRIFKVQERIDELEATLTKEKHHA